MNDRSSPDTPIAVGARDPVRRPPETAVIKLEQHLRDLAQLLRAGRLLEAEALERHLLNSLSRSEHPDYRIMSMLLAEPRDSASGKISAVAAALRYLEHASSAAFGSE